MSKLSTIAGSVTVAFLATACAADATDLETGNADASGKADSAATLESSGPYVVRPGAYRGLGRWVDTDGNQGPIRVQYTATGPDAAGLYHGAQRSVAVGAAIDADAFAGTAYADGDDLVFAADYEYTYTSNTSFEIAALVSGQTFPIGAGTSAPGAYQFSVTVPSGPVTELGFFGPYSLRRSGSLVSTGGELTMFYDAALVRL